MPSRFTIALLLFVTACPALDAAEPTIRNLDIRGLRIGGMTTLTIDGEDLGKAPKLLLPFAFKQSIKPGNTDKKAAFEVALDEKIDPGYYHLRVVGDGGVSLPVVIAVDSLPQQLVAEPIKQVPVALHGSVAGANIVEAKFESQAKQRILVEVESLRIGSKLRPIVHLYGPDKRQIEWRWGTPTLHLDCRLEATLPIPGTYTVTLHDAEYAAPAPSFFRMRVGEWSYVDQIFPSALSRNSKFSVELIGSTTKDLLSVNTMQSAGATPLAWPNGKSWSGPRPFISVSPHGEYVHQPSKDKPQDLPPELLAVSGKLQTIYDEHRYRIAVKPLSKIRLEVFAERIGSPLDAALIVRNEKGDQLARAEDSPGTLDPILEYTVPDKVTSIIVGVLDAQGRAGPRSVYRMVVEPQGSIKEYKLTTLLQRLTLPAGGRVVMPITVDRRGNPGPIELIANLPAGVKASGTIIPEGADGTLVTLDRGDSPFGAAITTWGGRDGTSKEKKREGETPIFVKAHPMERIQPWLAQEIAIAPSNFKASDFAIDWAKLSPGAVIVPGTKLALGIKAIRPADKTTVKLTLVTSQNTPIVNNAPDPNKALRQEKPIEMPVKATDGEVVMLIPADLSSPVYDVTVQAELLDAAKKPIAVTYAPVRRMAVKIPIVVKLDGPTRIETPIDVKKGAIVKLQGKIERFEGIKSDVALALIGLPAGAKAEAVTVKGDATGFTLNVTFPPNVPPGEIKGVKLSGSYAPDAKLANIRVRSREVELTLVLQAPPK